LKIANLSGFNVRVDRLRLESPFLGLEVWKGLGLPRHMVLFPNPKPSLNPKPTFFYEKESPPRKFLFLCAAPSPPPLSLRPAFASILTRCGVGPIVMKTALSLTHTQGLRFKILGLGFRV